jgi:hypothetical protein
MGHHDVYTWLGLAPGTWPPDYYTLLGLEPGDSDVERIEQHVHERLARLRSHQLQHPDQAAEAMNLLARAFSCLTDPEAKKAYDASLFGQPREAPPGSPEAKRPSPEPSREPVDPLAWLFGPWSQATTRETVSGSLSLTQRDWTVAPPPPRLPAPPEPPMVSPQAPADINGVPPMTTAEAAANSAPAPPVPAPAPVDPLVEAAHSSSARRGLGTKRALYYRIARTRQLIWAWEGAGKYLRQPARRLTRSNEAADLIRQLNAVRRLLRRFPPLLGKAGQAGFYVVTLARQPKHAIIHTFRMLLPSQRETLARDWRDGYQLLVAHRQFLRQELRALRQTTRWGRLVRAVTATLNDHRRLVMVLGVVLGLVAITWLAALAVILWYRFFH